MLRAIPRPSPAAPAAAAPQASRRMHYACRCASSCASAPRCCRSSARRAGWHTSSRTSSCTRASTRKRGGASASMGGASAGPRLATPTRTRRGASATRARPRTLPRLRSASPPSTAVALSQAGASPRAAPGVMPGRRRGRRRERGLGLGLGRGLGLGLVAPSADRTSRAAPPRRRANTRAAGAARDPTCSSPEAERKSPSPGPAGILGRVPLSTTRVHCKIDR